MFNKELFLTHIENAPIPQQLGEPLVEMKQKSDIDTIADIMGTSNVQRPLQEQGFATRSFAPGGGGVSPKPKEITKPREMNMVDGIPMLTPKPLKRKLSGVVSDITTSKPITPSPRPVRATRAQINVAKQKADRTIKSPGYKSQLTRADRDRIIGKVARETGVDSGTLSTNVSMRQSGVKGSGEGGSYTPQDRLNFTQVQVGKERREERKSYGLKPKADDYRLPGGGYDYDAMRSDQEESGEIPRSRRRGPSRFAGVGRGRGFEDVDPGDRKANLQRAREIMQKIENEDKA